jgi:hypothetical protein
MKLEEIYKTLGQLDAKVTAAHTRLDKTEEVIAKELAEIKKDVRDLLAWWNRSMGWAAALLFAGSIVGGIGSYLVSKLFK